MPGIPGMNETQGLTNTTAPSMPDNNSSMADMGGAIPNRPSGGFIPNRPSNGIIPNRPSGGIIPNKPNNHGV